MTKFVLTITTNCLDYLDNRRGDLNIGFVDYFVLGTYIRLLVRYLNPKY